MENLLNEILKENKIERNKIVDSTLIKLIDNNSVYELSKSIKSLKSQILQIFNMYKDKEEFKEAQLSIPNANVKKEYNYSFDLIDFPRIKIVDIKNLDLVGLKFDPEKSCISGVPTNANQIDIHIAFLSEDDENLNTDIKSIPFIVNADPKDLWLNKPSPKDSRFPKEDNVTLVSNFLDKKVVIASKRGRSHAHEGTFRDDDFAMNFLPNDWSILAVADGAGSSRVSRAGSQFTTEHIVKSFENEELLNNLSTEILNYYSEESDSTKNEQNTELVNDTNLQESKLKSKNIIINMLYSNVKKIHLDILEFASKEGLDIKDLHTTLIFILVKKFDFGYVVLSFGVGDCPINVLDKNENNVKLLNFLDVGEFGGGTRFITMPEIFAKNNIVDRFAINCYKDFSKIFLMTDGIYDPKFIVENKLENIATWKDFLKDLDGENEDQIKVDFINDSDIEKQLSIWMDFWSKGNHDDRTLAIIY